MGLHDFARSISGGDLTNRSDYVVYKSANTDVLTLIAARLADLPAALADITDAAGYAGAFHISLSPEGLPAFSGGGCLWVLDLARVGLLFARGFHGVGGDSAGSAAFLRVSAAAPRGRPSRAAVPGSAMPGT